MKQIYKIITVFALLMSVSFVVIGGEASVAGQIPSPEDFVPPPNPGDIFDKESDQPEGFKGAAEEEAKSIENTKITPDLPTGEVEAIKSVTEVDSMGKSINDLDMPDAHIVKEIADGEEQRIQANENIIQGDKYGTASLQKIVMNLKSHLSPTVLSSITHHWYEPWKWNLSQITGNNNSKLKAEINTAKSRMSAAAKQISATQTKINAEDKVESEYRNLANQEADLVAGYLSLLQKLPNSKAGWLAYEKKEAQLKKEIALLKKELANDNAAK